MTKKAKKARFKPPVLSDKKYWEGMCEHEFEDLCAQVYKQNWPWVRRNFPRDATWCVVTHGGRIIDSNGEVESHWSQSCGYPPVFLQAIGYPEARGSRVYVLRRPPTYTDMKLFFRKSVSDGVLGTLGKTEDDASLYNDDLGILAIETQSGVLDRFRKKGYALGRMVQQCTRSVDEARYKSGATVVTVAEPLYDGKTLYFSSQPRELVHARGLQTSEDREPGRWHVLQRLHRFDDPVLDVLDTYEMARAEQSSWPELILYRHI